MYTSAHFRDFKHWTHRWPVKEQARIQLGGEFTWTLGHEAGILELKSSMKRLSREISSASEGSLQINIFAWFRSRGKAHLSNSQCLLWDMQFF